MCSWLVFWEDNVRESDCEITHTDSLHEKLTEHLCCLHQIENRSKQRMKGKGVVREGSSYSLRIHLHQGLWLKTDESVNVSLMHQFCKIECLPSCYLWCFSLYYVSVFIIGTICSLFFPNFIFHWLQVDLFCKKHSAQAKFQFGCSICEHNLMYQQFPWIWSLHKYTFGSLSSIEKSSISLMQSLNYFTSIEMFVLWRSRWVLILRQAKRIMLSDIRKK